LYFSKFYVTTLVVRICFNYSHWPPLYVLGCAQVVVLLWPPADGQRHPMFYSVAPTFTRQHKFIKTSLTIYD